MTGRESLAEAGAVGFLRARASPEELLAFQRLAWSTVVLSVTQRCPLSCAHCITSSGPRVGSVLTAEQARSWALELPGLADDGLRHMTFTGGEPVLAARAVAILAEAAASVGVRTAIVSSGAWGRTPASAARVVAKLVAVEHWDLGYDRFHAADLAFDRFLVTLDALRDAGASFSVRICEQEEGAEAELVERLRDHCGPDTLIITQPVKQLGRARDLPVGDAPQPVVTPCLSTGPLVRDDGSVAPCCSGLSYERGVDTPFDFGEAAHVGLRDIWHAWRDDQLLRLMRLVGMAPVLQWLDAEGVAVDVLPTTDVCELCCALWTVPGAAAVARRRADAPAVRAKLDELEAELFGRVWTRGH